MFQPTTCYNQTGIQNIHTNVTTFQPISQIPILPIHSTITPIQQFATINTIKIQNNVHSNSLNTINHNIPINLSTQLGIETQNTIISAITKQLNNIQQIISNYTKTFNIPLQSLSNTINNYSPIKQINLWQSLSNEISNCIIIQNQMYKDILFQKSNVDKQLNSILQTMIQLSQQKIVLIDTPQINMFNSNMVNNINCQISVPSTANCQINKNSSNQIPHHSNSEITNQNNIISENNKQLHTHTHNIRQSNKKKRKRRGYNGPYSQEEQNFMRNWQKNETPQDILNMSIEMENKFKVKRSPYGLAQKMYQLGIINSRLKAIFQRQLEKEGKEGKESKEYSSNCMSDDTHSVSNSSIHSNINANDINTDETINCNYINISHNIINESKKKPFTIDEVNYIKNVLIINYKNEQPRKLYWRFIHKFTEWKNDNKSYQKFYHKYWILTNDIKKNLLGDNNNKKITGNNVVLNQKTDDRKRCIQFPNIVPPHKKIKLQIK